MLRQFSELIQRALQPYDREITKLWARIEELERRQDNQIKPGVVAAIHPGGRLIRVSYDNNTTPWIKWFAASAGEIVEYRCPSIGEQCALLNYGGGEDSGQVWALCGIPSGRFPLPAATPGLRVVSYPGGMSERFNAAVGEVTVTAPSKITANTPELHGTAEVSDSKRTMTGDRAIFDGHDHTEQGDGANVSKPNQTQG